MSSTLSVNVSLRNWLSPAFEQGSEGSCTACAVTNMINEITHMDGQNFGAVNTQAFYNMELHAAGDQKALSPPISGNWYDVGAADTVMMSVLHNQGVTAQTQPYGYAVANIGASTAGFAADAALHKVSNPDTVIHAVSFANSTISTMSATDLVGQIAQQLMQGKGLLMAMSAQQWMLAASGMPLSSQLGYGITEGDNNIIGQHEVFVVGANTATHEITVQSWGASLGTPDAGLFKINLDHAYTTDFLGNKTSTIADLYAVNGFNGIDLTQNAKTLQVAEAYNAVLDRAPEASAMKNAVAALNSGATLTTLCNNMFLSSEFKTLHPLVNSNAEVVTYLFGTILGRPPEASGLAFYTNALNSGESRGQLASELINTIADSSHWSADHLTYSGSSSNDPNLMSESARLYNRAQASEDYAIAMHAGDTYGSVAASFLTHVTADPNSVIASLIGVGTQLGHPFAA